MSDVNIPMLRKAVEWVEEQDKLPKIESRWNQGQWLTDANVVLNDAALEALGGPEWFWSATYSPQTLREKRKELEHLCGTAYCVAGYVAQLHDERYAVSAEVEGNHSQDVARRVLGLSADQADRLFYGENTAADVRRIAEEIAGEKL